MSVPVYLFRGEAMTAWEIAELTGLCRSTVLKRLKRGEDPDAPRRYAAKHGGGRKVLKYAYKGKMLSMEEISFEAGIPLSTLRSRWKKRQPGETIEEIANRPVLQGRYVRLAPPELAGEDDREQEPLDYEAALAERAEAARKIAELMLPGAALDEAGFRETAPGVWTFRGDLIGYEVRFSGLHSAALSAWMRSTGERAMLRRFETRGGKVREV